MGRRGGSGAVLNRRPAVHRGRGARVAVATAREATGVGSGVFAVCMNVVQVERKGEKGRGAPEGPRMRACSLERSGGHGARASRGERGGERRGPTVQQVADVEAASGDTRGRPKAVGSSRLEAATVRERTVARSRAPEWLARPRPRRSGRVQHAQSCLEGQGRSKEMACGLGCSREPLE